MPGYLFVFVGLTVYVWAQGFIMETSGLAKYYWLCNCIFLLSIYTFTGTGYSHGSKNFSIKHFLYNGVVFLAFVEAAVVILQYGAVIAVPTRLFRCTGTWSNPNISAIFLALSLTSVLFINKNAITIFKKLVSKIVLLIVLIALFLLGSRTAFLVTIIILLFEYSSYLYALIYKYIKIGEKQFEYSLYIFFVVVMILLSVFVKEKSTSGRIYILKNAIEVISQKPILGYGFGQFERDYNLYTASKNTLDNEHVNMAYNDFIELGIEGGLVGFILWVLFLGLLIGFCLKNGIIRMYPVVLSFIIVQVTNFGFQAIPIMVLFLMYIGVEAAEVLRSPDSSPILGSKDITHTVLSIFLLIISIIGLINTSKISGAFYRKAEIVKKYFGQNRVKELLRLSEVLNPFSSFHENIGDAFLQASNYENALMYYSFALKKSSSPSLFSKLGYCYQMVGKFDSSQREYEIVQRMEPKLLSPHLALLNLFHQKKDTLNIIREAKMIIEMPVKIQNARSDEIKQYADSIFKIVTNPPVIKVLK